MERTEASDSGNTGPILPETAKPDQMIIQIKYSFRFVADFLQGAPDFLLKFLRNTAEFAVDLIVDHFVQCLAEDIRLPDIEGIFPELSAEVADEIPALVFKNQRSVRLRW